MREFIFTVTIRVFLSLLPTKSVCLWFSIGPNIFVTVFFILLGFDLNLSFNIMNYSKGFCHSDLVKQSIFFKKMLEFRKVTHW